MLPLRLYIKDFCCFAESSVDFTKFSYALITGAVEGNSTKTNAIGKSVLFKAIEYVLFNECDFALERIIRDDQDSCKVILDFELDDNTYRVSRSRNKRGSTDLTVLKLKENNDLHKSFDKDSEPYWEDLSSRTNSHTEKFLSGLIKMNYTSFRSTVHFVQKDDNSSLAELTPTKRKTLLKESLNLAIYAKLEKIAKEKSSLLQKEIDKYNAQLEVMEDCSYKIPSLLEKISESNKIKEQLIVEKEKLCFLLDSKKPEYSLKHQKVLEKQTYYKSIKSKIDALLLDKVNVDKNITAISTRKSQTATSAKEIVSKIDESKKNLSLLSNVDLNEIKSQISNSENNIISLKSSIKQIEDEIKKLKIPLPSGTKCDYCRNDLSQEHLQKCQEDIDNSISSKEKELSDCKSQLVNATKTLNELNVSFTNGQKNNQKIIEHTKYIEDAKPLYEERKKMYEEYSQQLNAEKEKILKVAQDIDDLSKTNIDISITDEYKVYKECLSEKEDIENQIKAFESKISSQSINNYQYEIDTIQANVKKIQEINVKIQDLNEKIKAYPHVIQAFSSTGIPNFIVQNMLDDLQAEANNILPQLHEGLSLSFSTQKMKKDESQDTLDIFYHINGRERVFEQLSGAQSLAAIFSLKIGLMFILKNIIGSDFRMLLLDEVDHPLDESSIDSYYEIIKKFSEIFKVLVISHNKEFKSKMNNTINITQDYNKVSRIV